MEITIGKYAGMCGGVKYTILEADKILDEHKGEKVYCLGELVHNSTVVNKLEQKGLRTIENIGEAEPNSIIIFRAHGVTKDNYKKAKEMKLKVFDLTCKNVSNIHDKVIDHSNSFIIILGKKDHPEAVATKSFAKNAFIVENENDIEQCIKEVNDSTLNNVYIIAQTTYSSTKFDKISQILAEKLNEKNVEIDKTICMATEIRQKEAENLCKDADTVIVIGGKNSSNTRKLFEIALQNCLNVQYIDDSAELDIDSIKGDKIVILAGASTPDESILETKEKIKNLE